MPYQYVKDYIVVPSINAIKNFITSRKNSVNHIYQQEIASKITKYTTEKVITKEKRQPTYIHI